MTLCSNLAYDKNILYVLVPSIDFFFLLIGGNERVEGIQTLKIKSVFCSSFDKYFVYNNN